MRATTKFVAVAALALGVSLATAVATAAERVALLIGNSGYPGAAGQGDAWERLPNPVNDVQLVSNALWANGFEVRTLKNGSYAEISRQIDEFARLAGEADVAVVYYAGHGFEYGRRNFLVPVDAPTTIEAPALPNRYIDFDRIVKAAARAKKVNVFFLDACRTGGTFVTVGGVAGGTPRPIDDVQYPQGAPLAILYSTARGEPALDSAPPPADYSPFAWAVAANIVVPRVDIGYFFAAVTYEVRQKTKSVAGMQSPYSEVSLGPGFYFNDSDPQAGAVEETPARLPISERDLANVDEPVLAVRVLRQHNLREVEAIAGKGDPVATYLLGYMYEFGVGAPQNLETARRWLEKAAAQKTAYGELELAYFLSRHPASDADKARALSLFESAAARGYPKAKAHLASVLMTGSLGRLDYERGRGLLGEAAAAGYPYAAYALATLGDDRFRSALKDLADGGDVDGAQWLCELAAAKGDYGGAGPYCLDAAKAGSSIAQARLAIAYGQGRGFPQSDYQAQHWARLALSQSALPDYLREQVLTLRK